MKNFHDKNLGKVHYWNLETMRIGATSTKKLGTEEGYYFDSTEELLSKEIEKPLSMFVGKVLSFCENTELNSLQVTEEESTILIKYVLSLLGRSNHFEDTVIRQSIASMLFSKQFLRAFSADFVLHSLDTENVFIQNMHIGLIHNTSDRSLVVPRNGCYLMKRGNEKIVVIPVSPTCAFTLIPSDSYFDWITDNISIDYLNMQATICEKQFNNAFVLTDNKKDLEILKQKCEESFIDFRSLLMKKDDVNE